MSDNKKLAVELVEDAKLVADVATLAAGVGALVNPVIGVAAVVVGAGVAAFRLGEKAAELHDKYTHRPHTSDSTHVSAEASSVKSRFTMFSHLSQAAVAKCADQVFTDSRVIESL